MRQAETTSGIGARYRQRRQANRLARELAESPRLRSEIVARMASTAADDAGTWAAVDAAVRAEAHRTNRAVGMREVSPFG